MPEYILRNPTQADLPDIVGLQSALEKEDAIWGYQADSLEDWLTRDLKWSLIAVGDDEKCAGFIYCSLRRLSGECVFPTDARVLEIAELVVRPERRGSGIGRQLVTAIQARARKEGYTHLRVYSASKRFDDILRFYRGCDFEPWYVEMTHDVHVGTARGVCCSDEEIGI